MIVDKIECIYYSLIAVVAWCCFLPFACQRVLHCYVPLSFDPEILGSKLYEANNTHLYHANIFCELHPILCCHSLEFGTEETRNRSQSFQAEA
jgi:hypothetical protein